MKKPYYNQEIREILKLKIAIGALFFLQLSVLKFKRAVYQIFYPNEKRIPIIKYLAKVTPYQREEIRVFIEKLRLIDGDNYSRTWAIIYLDYCIRINRSLNDFIMYYQQIKETKDAIKYKEQVSLIVLEYTNKLR